MAMWSYCYYLLMLFIYLFFIRAQSKVIYSSYTAPIWQLYLLKIKHYAYLYSEIRLRPQYNSIPDIVFTVVQSFVLSVLL